MTVKDEKSDKTERNSSDFSEKTGLDNSNNDDAWGSDLYPERKGNKYKSSWVKTLLGVGGRESIDHNKCENSVYNCITDSPIIKLMVGALKSSGCEIDIRRHFCCEVCSSKVTGGFDSELNQVVICQNTAITEGMVQVTLLHEMIHMFDYCRNKLDVRNIDHLACTEIRAANLAHCSFMTSLVQGQSSPFNIKATHQNCVKDKAIKSVMGAHKVSAEVAEAAVERVFTRCYNDLEPVGRRIRRNSDDMPRAYAEGHLYGYDT